MSIYDAMRTAISGLQAQSYSLDQISGNIANSQTIGYKRTETSFAELVPDSSVSSAAVRKNPVAVSNSRISGVKFQ